MKLRCPTCGGKAQFLESFDEEDEGAYVCSECGEFIAYGDHDYG